NTGRIEAKTQNVHLQSRAEIKQDGSVIARTGEVNAKAQTTLSQRGETIAKGKISYKAADVNTTQSSLIAAGVTTTQTDKGENRQLDRQTQQGSAVDIQADNHAQLAGHNIAAGTLNIAAQSVNLDNSQNNAHDIHLQAHSGNIQADNSQLSAVENLRISTPKTLSTQHSQLSANRIQTTQQDLITKGATWKQTGTEDFRLSGKYIQTQGATLSTQGRFVIQADHLNNEQGILFSEQTLSITGDKINTQKGQLIGQDVLLQANTTNNDSGLIYAKNHLDLTSAHQLSNQHAQDKQQGIIAQKSLTLHSQALSNTQGYISAGEQATFHVAQIDNQAGKIRTDGPLTLNSRQVTNNQGVLFSQKNMQLAVDHLSQQQGHIESEQLTFKGQQLHSSEKSAIIANQIDITTAQQLANIDSQIIAEQQANFRTGGQLNNQGGTIASREQDLTLHTAQHALNNQQGKLIASRHLTVESGEFTNDEGTIFAQNVMINTNQQSLKNRHTLNANRNQGILAQDKLQLNLGDLDNQQGLISSDNQLNIQAKQLTNQHGQLRSQGVANIEATALINDHGHVQSASALQLISQTIAQQNGVINGKALQINTAQLNSHQHSEISGEDVHIDTALLDNNQSHILAEQTLDLNARQGIKNQQGTIASLKGNAQINTQQTALENQQGTLFANAQLTLNTGHINNQQGTIRAQQLTIDTHQQSIDNRQTLADNTKGIIAEDLTLHSAALNNAQGRVIVKNQGTLITDSLDNQSGEILMKHQGDIHTKQTNNVKGVIATTEGDLKLHTATTLQNQQGTITSKGHLSLESAGLDNQQGMIAANTLDLNSLKQTLFNQQGKITAQESAVLNTGEIHNQQGLIRADKQLTLDAHQHNIHNQNTQGKDQGIVGLGQIVLQNITALSNTQGFIYGKQGLDIVAQDSIHNAQGVLESDNRLTLSANKLDNQAGTIRGQHASLRAEHIDNRAISQQGSLIIGSQTLTLNSQHIDNQGTKASASEPQQGIQSQQLNIHTDTLSNQQGGIYSGDTAHMTVTAQLNNQQGELLSANHLTIEDKGQLTLNNQAGIIQSKNALSIKAKTLEDEGKIKTQGDLSIGLIDSFTLNQAFEVGRNLDFRTEGDFQNNTSLVIGNKALISAKNINNTASAEISAEYTALSANTLTNRGLIDGTKTVLHTQQLDNIGTGRIYGNHLSIQAKTLNNIAEESNNETKAATIAARERLDLGVGTLTNRDHALIFSVNEMAIGGALDQNGYAIGKADFIDNGSATIEALGKGWINASRLLNHDIHLKTGIDEQNENYRLYARQYTENGLQMMTDWYREGEEYDGKWHRYNGHKSGHTRFLFHDKTKQDPKAFSHGQHDFWHERIFNRNTKTTTIEHADPAKILIGGDLVLAGESQHNQYSKLSIGGRLILNDQVFTQNDENQNVGSLINEDLIGYIDTHDVGDFKRYYFKREPTRGRRWSHKNFREVDIHNKIDETSQTPFFFKLDLNPIGQSIKEGSQKTIEDKLTTQDVNLNTIKIIAPTVRNLNQTSLLAPEIQEAKPIDVLATPTLDEKDKNTIVSSGQVIGTLNTQIDNLDQFSELKMPVIKTHLADIRLPDASLYKINPNTPNGYLVEVDPRFTDRQQWLSSDYMFNALRYDHENQHKRLGDGFYEQRLINEQIHQLTGRHHIAGYKNDLEQYKALMNSGIEYAKKFNLTPGIGLTAQQMSELTTDMVWFVNKTLTLANGQSITVLTPQVYLVARNTDIHAQGAVISANQIIGNVGNVENSGVIAGRKLTHLNAEQFTNRGVVLGDSVDLSAKQTLVNLGGRIEAVDSLALSAVKGIEIGSTLSHAQDKAGHFSQTLLDQLGSVNVTGKGGKLTISSQENVSIKGAEINSQGTAHISGKSIDINTLTTKNKTHYIGDANNYYRLDQKSEVGSTIQSKEGIKLIANNDVNLRQATVSSEDSSVLVGSLNGKINIEAGRTEEQLATGRTWTHRGTVSKTTDIHRYKHDIQHAEGSQIDGKNVAIIANKGDVNIKGSTVVGEEKTQIAGENVSILSDTHSQFRDEFKQTRKSGLMGSGGIGFTIGSKKERIEQDNRQESAAHSQVGSLTGDTHILARKHYQQTGSIVSSRDGDVNILAESGKIEAARSDYESNYKRTTEQKGLTISLNVPVVQAIQAAASAAKSVQKVGESKNNRINAMAAANAGFEAMRAAEQLAKATEAIGNGAQGMSQGVSVSITYGQQKSVETRHSEGNQAEKSQINAGGKVNIQMAGAGKDSTLTIAGADIGGQQGTKLKAEGNIDVLAVDENHLERSTNKSSGFNVGVAIAFQNGVSAGITAGANVAKGYGNGDSQAWVGSQIGSRTGKTEIESGETVNIKGSQVLGHKVNLVADNLNIESLQDTARYKGKQMSASGQVTVGYGFSASGSFNQSKVNSDYASVKTQAGIFAGDGGYDIEVNKHTDLKGGLITSSDKAEAEDRNRFSTGTLSHEDVGNHSSHSANGFGLSGGVTVSGGEAPQELGGVKLLEVGQNHQDGGAKVELGGVAGVGSQGNWGVAKGLATALLGQVSDKGSDNSVTTSSINTHNIHIRDEQAQLELTGKTAEETAQAISQPNSHRTLAQADVEKIKSDLEQNLAISNEFVNKVSEIGDEIHYRIEKNEQNIFVKEKREAGCQSIECIQEHALDVNKLDVPRTKEEAEKLARMYAHGILNKDDKSRTIGAIQYGGKDYLENDVLVVRKPYTSINAELGFTVLERFRAGLDMPSVFGASNASKEQAKVWGLLEEYNKQNPNNPVDLKHLAHSLGVSSTKNAMNWAAYKGITLDNTVLHANTVGTSYPMRNSTIGGTLSGGLYNQGYTEKAASLFKSGTIEYAVAPRDTVATGANLPFVPGALSFGIGNTNTTGNNLSGIPLVGIVTGAHTKAYYKDEEVIKFLTPDREQYNKITNYQQEIWGKIGPKTKSIYFQNGSVINNNEVVK
ncbi:hemagglutinin repeat-containing protein, partial [Conservatibacter flavescens]